MKFEALAGSLLFTRTLLQRRRGASALAARYSGQGCGQSNWKMMLASSVALPPPQAVGASGLHQAANFHGRPATAGTG